MKFDIACNRLFLAPMNDLGASGSAAAAAAAPEKYFPEDPMKFAEILCIERVTKGAKSVNTAIANNVRGCKDLIISELSSSHFTAFIIYFLKNQGQTIQEVRTFVGKIKKKDMHFYSPVPSCEPSLATYLGLGCENSNPGIVAKVNNAANLVQGRE